jgi:DNA repair protein SbcC/Rad50
MRPARLELKGFTAYRETQILDFDHLDLFAVTGPTGSGKSSLLDAMTYALFGKVARVGVQASHLIAQGQPRLSVMFDFDVDGHRYRVTRSTGRKAAQSAVRLERWRDGGWVSFGEGADRVKEATRLIKELIGLDYQAFTRSVLLPQGQFQEFLVGDPKERRDILTELLDLKLFERMAGRAGEIARGAKAAAAAKEEVLSGPLAGVDREAVRQARKRAKELREGSEAMAAIERALEALSKTWEAERRRIEALEELTGEAEDLSGQAHQVADELEALGKEVAEAQERAAEVEKAARKATARSEQAAAALAEGEENLGTLEVLARLRAGLEELARLDSRIRAADEALAAARALMEDGEKALVMAREATEAAGIEYQQASAARAEAEAEHHRALEADLVATLTKEKKLGDPCPICSRPLEQLPKAEYKILAKALRDLERAAEVEKRVGDIWGKAERDEVAAERDLAAARRHLAARQAEIEGCGQEREGLLPGLAGSFGGELPADPVAEVGQRVGKIQRLSADLERRVAEKGEAHELAARAREEAGSLAGRGVATAARLQALPLPALLKRARAEAPDLQAPPALSEAVPAAPAEAARVARAWALGLSDLAGTLARATEETHRGLDELLNQAREALPEDIPMTLVTDVEELLKAVRVAARDLVAEAASAAKDAERMVEELAEREALVNEVRALGEQAGVYHALAGELKANRLISFLQAEALELLAEAGSERLLFLSQDRYRLVFDREEDEFYVEDRQNGDERRSVRTLSGGETFLASLALALALAEEIPTVAVTQRSHLQSLFIDEGFGALDPESLEVATEALSRLGGQDRMVGVITHVSELAEKMPVRVVVEKLSTGSRLEVQS